jgi:hypothetical protein
MGKFWKEVENIAQDRGAGGILFAAYAPKRVAGISK